MESDRPVRYADERGDGREQGARAAAFVARHVGRRLWQPLMIKRAAGLLIPLFSLRSLNDFGRGEIRALVPMADFALAIGHRVLQLLPIDETAPAEASPYSAMSVMAVDPRYISAAGLDGVNQAAIDSARGIAGPGDPPDPVRLYQAKLELLRKSFHYFQARATTADREAFGSFMRANRDWLPDYALFRALKDRFEWAPWESWPDGLNQRNSVALEVAARELAAEVAAYTYIQFVAHRQWSEMRAALAARGVLIGGDLAFSPCRESAEVWANQAIFDLSRSVGAPPDAFSKSGQRWGLPMPDWERMRASNFALIRMRVRHARELFDLLRIDHVVGLFRTFAFTDDPDAGGAFDPATEPAQRAQGEEIIAAANQEANSLALIAEDLGVIPPFVRQSLVRHGIPGYKVMRWERLWDQPAEPFIPPSSYPELSIATTGTHDTETMTEWWREASLEERKQFVKSLAFDGEIDPRNPALDGRALEAALGALYAAPSRLAIVPLQDVFGWPDRINTPATVTDLNWKWRLPFPLEQIPNDPGIMARISAMRTMAQRTSRF